MDGIQEQAERMISQCMAQGFAVEPVPDRHHADALRAELRRPARRFKIRISTHHDDDQGRVAIARRDELPWDEDERTAAERLSRYIIGDDG